MTRAYKSNSRSLPAVRSQQRRGSVWWRPWHRSSLLRQFVQQALWLPGACVQQLSGSSPHLGLPTLSRAEIVDEITASPRGNAYLSLEAGVEAYRCGEGLIAAKSAGKHLFAVGGVHASASAWSSALALFREEAERVGFRRVLLFPVSESEVEMCESAGMSCIQVGAEAFLEPTTFSMTGRRMADLRQMVNRARKRYKLSVEEVDPAEEAESMGATYQQWLGEKQQHSRTMQLLIGTLCLDFPAERRYFVVRSPAHEEPVVVVTLTPGWDGQGWGLDVMARRPEAPAGAMELVLVEILGLLAEEGISTLTLGASPMASIQGDHGAAYLRSLFRFLYRSKAGNLLFHFKPLFQFKDKFAPEWKPVFIAGWPNIGPWSLYVGCHMWGLY